MATWATGRRISAEVSNLMVVLARRRLTPAMQPTGRRGAGRRSGGALRCVPAKEA